MNAIVQHLFRRCALALALCLFALTASAHRGQDFLKEQDFKSTPPRLTGAVKAWVAWVGVGEYDRSGGQPFAAPLIPGLPPDVTDITIQVDMGSYQTSSGGVTCHHFWDEVFVFVKFTDGSQFVWSEVHTSNSCSDGSSESFDHVIATGGVEDPLTGAWSGWVRSYGRDMLSTYRRTALRGSAGATLSLSALEGEARPWIGAEHDELELTLDQGGVLDLRGLSGNGGPLFASGSAALLRCDTILLDPGVTLADLFAQPPQVGPGTSVRELALSGAPVAHFDASGPGSIELRLFNLGNTPELALASWIDVLAWSWGGPLNVPIAPGDVQVTLQIPLTIPAGAQVGELSVCTVTAIAAGAQSSPWQVLLERTAAAPLPASYCSAKLNSQGCLPRIEWSGTPTASGYDDFVVRASNVLSGKAGIMIYGFAPASLPFQGGSLCIQPPISRTLGQVSQSQGIGPCSGAYALHFDHEFMAAHGMLAGNSVHCQWWSRDPASSFGVGLSDALQFTPAP